MEDDKRDKLAKESYIIMVICLLDLATTLWLILTGQASEGNPLMSYYLSMGWAVLVVMKIVLLVLPIFVLEWCRRHRTQFVRTMLRITIVAYVSIYALGFLHLNILAFDRSTRDSTSFGISHAWEMKH
jgi:hypothetical protein